MTLTACREFNKRYPSQMDKIERLTEALEDREELLTAERDRYHRVCRRIHGMIGAVHTIANESPYVMPHPVRVLLVEDDDNDAAHLRRLVQRIDGGAYGVERASSFREGHDIILERRHDLYLLDEHLADGSGVDLLSVVQNGSYRPAILVSGNDVGEVDIQALRRGAADYIVKGDINAHGLERCMRYAMERAQMVNQLWQIKSQHEKLFGVIEQLIEGILDDDTGGLG